MPLFFMQATTGDKLVVVADTPAEAEARAASAGFTRAGPRPYRVEASAVQPHVGGFRFVPPPVVAPPAAGPRAVFVAPR